jgi:hypothetical protein
MNTFNLFQKIGAAQKAMEEAKNAVDLAHKDHERITRKEAQILEGYVSQAQYDGDKLLQKLFAMKPEMRIVREGKKVRFVG